MLGTMCGSKAAAAAGVPKGGLPTLRRAYRPISRGWTWQVARSFGLLPMGATLSAWGGSMLPSLASSSAPAKVLAKLNATAILFLLQTKAKQAAICLLIALSCAGAGAATVAVVNAATSLAASPSSAVSPVARCLERPGRSSACEG